MKGHLTNLSLFWGDVLRFCAECFIYLFSGTAGSAVLVLVWRSGTLPGQILAIPLGLFAFGSVFLVFIVFLGVTLVKGTPPGRYALSDPAVLRWMLADGVYRMVQRSFLRHFMAFAPQRVAIYRLMGAKIDATLLLGWGAKVVDPWLFDAGHDVVIGTSAVICGHLIDGGAVEFAPVVIGDGATVGAGATLLPGVEIGEDAVVAAGAVVSKGTRVPPREIWAGIPARKIGTVSKSGGQGQDDTPG